jgi:hypothetical protein
MKKTLSLFIIFLILIGTIVASIVINDQSKNGQIIPVTIIIDNPNPLINESVHFRLTTENDYPFHINELAAGAGICICRIPDNVDPYTIGQNISYLENLSMNGVHGSVGLKDYSDKNKTISLEWNCTILQYNPLLNNETSSYTRAPAGYYIIYRSDLNSYSNDNLLKFRVSNNSIFHLSGVTPNINFTYESSNETMNVKIHFESSSELINQKMLFNVGIYIQKDNDSMLQISHYEYNNTFSSSDVTMEKWVSNLSINNNETVFIFGLIQTDGVCYSISSKQVI